MQLTIDIPNESAERFRQVFGPNLDKAAKEALLIDGYRTGRISLGFVAEVLELPTRLEAQRWLAAHHVPLNWDLEELEVDRDLFRNTELSVEQAADLLNVSYPFLMKLLKNDTIPSREVGNDRRIRFDDLCTFKQRGGAARHAALENLTAEGQELNMGY